MLNQTQINNIYEDAAQGKYSVITADAIIETIDGNYHPDPQHRIDGKDIKAYLTGRGWIYCGEVSKMVSGNLTTVGLYINRPAQTN